MLRIIITLIYADAALCYCDIIIITPLLPIITLPLLLRRLRIIMLIIIITHY